MTRNQLQRIAIASLIAVVGLVGTSALGVWQYSRAHRDDISKQVLAATPVPVETLVSPAKYVPEGAFAHEVIARGTLVAADALLSCDRFENGAAACWVLAPVQLGSGTGITVVLGSAGEADAASALASVRALGTPSVEVRGRIQPGEVIERAHAIIKPADRVPYIAVNELAARWQLPLLDGYVVLNPPQHAAAITSPLILPPSGITWRNLMYAWQWWAFAAFIVFLLSRYIMDVRSEATRTLAHTEEQEQS